MGFLGKHTTQTLSGYEVFRHTYSSDPTRIWGFRHTYTAQTCPGMDRTRLWGGKKPHSVHQSSHRLFSSPSARNKLNQPQKPPEHSEAEARLHPSPQTPPGSFPIPSWLIPASGNPGLGLSAPPPRSIPGRSRLTPAALPLSHTPGGSSCPCQPPSPPGAPSPPAAGASC